MVISGAWQCPCTVDQSSGAFYRMKKYNCILIVEDSEIDMMLGTIIIESAEIALKILVARHGGEALKELDKYYAENNSLPEVIITDLLMPVMDGFDLIGEIRQHTFYSEENCQIIILTASLDRDEDIARIKLLGVENILLKPLDKIELLEIITKELIVFFIAKVRLISIKFLLR
jgi:CheY-like chemotaxis protein